MGLYYFLRDINTNGPSHMQIKKSYVNDNEVQNQELLTLDTISRISVKLKANYFHIISDDCN